MFFMEMCKILTDIIEFTMQYFPEEAKLCFVFIDIKTSQNLAK